MFIKPSIFSSCCRKSRYMNSSFLRCELLDNQLTLLANNNQSVETCHVNKSHFLKCFENLHTNFLQLGVTLIVESGASSTMNEILVSTAVADFSRSLRIMHRSSPGCNVECTDAPSFQQPPYWSALQAVVTPAPMSLWTYSYLTIIQTFHHFHEKLNLPPSSLTFTNNLFPNFP